MFGTLAGLGAGVKGARSPGPRDLGRGLGPFATVDDRGHSKGVLSHPPRRELMQTLSANRINVNASHELLPSTAAVREAGLFRGFETDVTNLRSGRAEGGDSLPTPLSDPTP